WGNGPTIGFVTDLLCLVSAFGSKADTRLTSVLGRKQTLGECVAWRAWRRDKLRGSNGAGAATMLHSCCMESPRPKRKWRKTEESGANRLQHEFGRVALVSTALSY